MPSPNLTCDFVVVGAGIVGLATAAELRRRYPDCRVVVAETERRVAEHQSGHNSGVLHSGLYYRPGSQRALTCRRGKTLMESFCDQMKIPWERCGKVVVATDAGELEALQRISERAEANGVDFRRINSDELRELEPRANGIAALHVPETGIVDYAVVCRKLAERIDQDHGNLRLNSQVVAIDHLGASIDVRLVDGQRLSARHLVNCAGLQSDRVARLAGLQTKVRIVPFRGEYYELAKGKEHLVHNLIYPVPDPAFPFLGVHFTRMINGGVECGPNAVLALSRKGYDWTTFSPRDLMETFAFKGFRKLARRHWKTGIGEMNRSLRKSAFVTALQKLMPSLSADDLVPGRAGVRAQAVSQDGDLIDDFLIEHGPSSTHVLNAPSPAATASLAIAETIVESIRLK
ncbi:L-2-hydroxyglutarate oxidase [Roseiconus lacunae]|uniref:L-2-hydroxyglutarate oxidase n=1 Tax=Roseiconus lacunae TaxID=2605694 RepID=UPI001E3EF8A3|nr:L-2-hydroxyglutarate oxidase [Roseiconus lacunae]MCD0463366.1 L-2-hydroxyglutarate oxidase [Roseiconus lacunae]WRQ48490.1 L-2-hydroxyglutarate oxidase [Stieleria sp. HD01]